MTTSKTPEEFADEYGYTQMNYNDLAKSQSSIAAFIEGFKAGAEQARNDAIDEIIDILDRKARDIRDGRHPILLTRTDREGQACTVFDCVHAVRALKTKPEQEKQE